MPTRRTFIRNSLGMVTLGMATPSILVNASRAWADNAETVYLFASARLARVDVVGAIHRFKWDATAGALVPAPSDGQKGSIWGCRDNDKSLGQSFQGIAIAPDGDVYASSATSKSVLQFDGLSGAFKGEIVTGINTPDALIIGADGNLYVSNDFAVMRYKLDGSPLPGLNQSGALFTIGGGLTTAQGLAFGPNGDLYVVNQAKGQVLRYGGKTGRFIDIFCSDHLVAPAALAFGTEGNLYVASVGGPSFNASGGYVARFDGVTGKFIDKFAPDAKGAMGLAFAPNGDLFVSDYWSTKISRYDGKSGKSLGVMENPLAGSSWYYLMFGTVSDAPGAQLKPLYATALLNSPAAIPLISTGVETTKGWKNGLVPKGKPGPLLTLASNRESEYSILVAANPTPMDQNAAEALAFWLKKMTSADIPIINERADVKVAGKVLSVGRTALLQTSGLPEANLDLGDEGYAVAVQGENLFLCGGKTRGAIYAVFSLLEEDLNCRWYTHSDDGGERISTLQTLSFRPTIRHFVPALTVRYPEYYDCNNTQWSIKNKTNSPDAPVPESWGGSAKTPPGYYTHTYDKLVPPEKYFAEHPEYFAEVNGKRQRSQLDLSNPDVFRITVASLTKVLNENPDTRYISVSPNDGRGYCECQYCSAIDKAEATRESSKTGSLIKFVNEVADAIAPEFPNVKISTLAYLDTFMPPKTLRPRNNVVIQLCTDSYAWRYAFFFVTETETFPIAMKAWNAIGADIQIWDYTQDYVHILVPFPNMPVVKDNIEFYIEHGAKGVMLEGTITPGGENALMRGWVWAKQLWDPSRDTLELMQDFVYGYFGTAADPIWEYNKMLWQMWEENHQKPHTLIDDKKPDGANPLLINDSPCSAPPDWPLLTDGFVQKSSALFSQAEELSKDAETLRRVKVAKLPIIYLKLGRGLGYYTEFGKYITGSWVKSGNPAQKAYYEDLLKEFALTTESVGMRDTGIGHPPKELIAKWQEMLDRAWTKVQLVPLKKQWKFKTDARDVGVAQGWFQPQAADATWSDVVTNTDKGWESQGFPDYQGFAWYQQNVIIPADLLKFKYLYLYFGAVDSESEIYINGAKVFDHTLASTGMTRGQIWNTPFAFDVSKMMKYGEENTITVRVTSHGGVRGIWKPASLFAANEEVNVSVLTEATAWNNNAA